MRSWNNQLFLGAMPGWYEDLTLWEDALQQNEIDCIVSLASEVETTEKSPEFATWLSASPPEYEVIRLPVPDYRVATGHQVEEFRDAALDVARDLKQGRRVFVHCGAGIGRTGLFAVAVLMGFGHTYEDALASIEAVGSGPETEHLRPRLAVGPESAHPRDDR